MSFKEMYDFLEEDRPRLDYQREKSLSQIRKEFITENVFPNYKYVEYNPKSGNSYLIIFCAFNSHQINKPHVRYCSIVWRDPEKKHRYIITWHKSEYRHTPMHKMEKTPMIYAFTEHFFKQYQKRFLKDETLSPEDTLCRFIMRNPVFTPIDINDKVNKNIGKKDSNYDRGFKVSDGMCFTRYGMDVSQDENIIGKEIVSALAFVFTTYYNPKDMPDGQKEAIEKEEDKSWELFFEYKINNHKNKSR